MEGSRGPQGPGYMEQSQPDPAPDQIKILRERETILIENYQPQGLDEGALRSIYIELVDIRVQLAALGYVGEQDPDFEKKYA